MMSEYYRAMVNQTTYRKVTLSILLITVLLIVAVLVANHGFGTDPQSSARTAVTEFGSQLQKVSLLAPDASSTMATVYGPLVTPELLAAWQADPERAPGRLTSSPYPARIDVNTIAKQGSGYVVGGVVVMETSDGVADRIPVVLQLVPQESHWLVAVYQVQSSTTPAAIKK